MSAGVSLGHTDFNGYRGVLRTTRVHPDEMRAECLLHINVSFSTHTQLDYDLSFIVWISIRMSLFHVDL